jgi:hypothetical protein
MNEAGAPFQSSAAICADPFGCVYETYHNLLVQSLGLVNPASMEALDQFEATAFRKEKEQKEGSLNTPSHGSIREANIREVPGNSTPADMKSLKRCARTSSRF